MFGTDAYVEILSAFKNKGYAFEKFLRPRNGKTIHLRHDIDFSVKEAHDLAVLEQKAGVFSTYFFMLTSNTYNLLSEVNQGRVKEIRSMGHDISLHFDPVAHPDIDKGFAAERALFESLFDVDVSMVSLHRPGAFLEQNNRPLPDCRHTYEDEFFREMKYISDSGGRDIQSQLIELACADEQAPLHVLIHPIWWTCGSESPTSTLQRWLNDQSGFMIEETRRNCKTFKG